MPCRLTVHSSLMVHKDFDQIGQFVTPGLNALSGYTIDWRVQHAVDFPSGPNDI